MADDFNIDTAPKSALRAKYKELTGRNAPGRAGPSKLRALVAGALPDDIAAPVVEAEPVVAPEPAPVVAEPEPEPEAQPVEPEPTAPLLPSIHARITSALDSIIGPDDSYLMVLGLGGDPEVKITCVQVKPPAVRAALGRAGIRPHEVSAAVANDGFVVRADVRRSLRWPE